VKPWLACLAAAIALAGCGHSERAPGGTKSTANPMGAVGSTLQLSDSSGTKLEVTVMHVIDPASGADRYSTPAHDKHFIGVQLRVQNSAAATYENNANNETRITLSNGAAVVADYNAIAGCSNFDNGQVSLTAGSATTGCVTFQVPNGKRIDTIQYGNAVFPGTTAQWRAS
jgi:hypothetical protein